MGDTDPKDGQSLVPAQTELQPAIDNKPSISYQIEIDEKGVLKVSPTEAKPKNPGDKKKMPRGSSAFRHA